VNMKVIVPVSWHGTLGHLFGGFAKWEHSRVFETKVDTQPQHLDIVCLDLALRGV